MGNITPGTCLFCARTKLSKEHKWPRWLRSYFEAHDKATTSHLVGIQRGFGAPNNLSPGPLNRPGDVANQSLRCVCIDCNRGWMSRIQDSAKPYLSRLIQNNWDNFDTEARMQVATWITMYTMVNEAAYRETSSIRQEERIEFARIRLPLPHWSIWVGKFSGEARQRATHHRGIVLNFSGDEKIYNTQATVAAFGNLIFFSVSSTFIDLSMFELRQKYSFQKISPYYDKKSMLTYNDDNHFNSIVQSFSEDLAYIVDLIS